MKDWLLEGHNAWNILGIPPQSSMEVLVRAFRRLSIRYQAEAAAAYLRISQARDALTHPTMRDLHDDLLARQHDDGTWSDDTQQEDPSTNW